MGNLRVLIASDLHMHNDALSAETLPSYLTSHPDYRGANQSPIKGIEKLLCSQKAKVDWILCPGDLGDKADITAQQVAWSDLESLRSKLHAKRLIATIGNHDVDSRGMTAAASPTDSLKKLTPPFPIRDTNLWSRFWTRDYTIYVEKARRIRLVVVNSCMFHSHTDPSMNKIERERGRVSENTIARIQSELFKGSYSLNIMMLHHHIRQHPFATNDTSHAIGGDQLIEVLKETSANWFIVHGHRHMPDLSYSQGGSNSPLVFSAGSVAALTWRLRGQSPRNQFYVVDFDVPSETGVTAALKGRIQSWDWTPLKGWQNACNESGLPRLCGFGFRGDVSLLAPAISSKLQTAIGRRMSWTELTSQMPDLSYMLPSDMELLLTALTQSKVVVNFDRWQFPSQFELERENV